MNKSYSRVLAGSALVAAIAVFMFYQSYKTGNEMTNLVPRSTDATASAEFVNAQRSVDFYRDQIRKAPDHTKNYVELAQIYLQEARVTALHHEYFPKAERLLAEALRIDPSDFNALVTQASMKATLHQFREAQDIVRKAIAINPYNAYAYGILCDTHVELGEYDQAVMACDKMLSVKPDLRSYARASYLREIHGDVRGAKIAMQMAADAGVPGQEARAWCFYNLGKMYLNEAKLDTAEFIFKGILAERPGYAHALSGLAHVKSAQEQWDQAIDLLQQAWKALPDHSFLEDLAGAYRVTGKADLAEKTIQLMLSEFSDHVKEGWNVDKEFAAFCADHGIELQQALLSARRDHERRPDNIEALDTYAWTLFKNGQTPTALPLIEKALRLGTQNMSMKYHAAMIYRASGNTARAAEMLREVSLMNPQSKIIYAADVRQALAEIKPVAAR